MYTLVHMLDIQERRFSKNYCFHLESHISTRASDSGDGHEMHNFGRGTLSNHNFVPRYWAQYPGAKEMILK